MTKPAFSVGDEVWYENNGEVLSGTIAATRLIFGDTRYYRLSSGAERLSAGIYATEAEAAGYAKTVINDELCEVRDDIKELAKKLGEKKNAKQQLIKKRNRLKRALDKESQCNR